MFLYLTGGEEEQKKTFFAPLSLMIYTVEDRSRDIPG